MSNAGKRPSICLFWGCASCLLAAGLKAQPPTQADPSLANLPHVYGPDLIRSLHPVSDAAELLRKSYLKAITYEDPLWEWPGEMRDVVGIALRRLQNDLNGEMRASALEDLTKDLRRGTHSDSPSIGPGRLE